MENKMNILQKLQIVQRELKAPKGQYNTFGKYKYRSCEDILTAVKPILDSVGAVIVLRDEAVIVGERYYIKATAMFYDTDGTMNMIQNAALAREDESKKGMDGSQITGTASSYARKYALNGLLLIDDTKDADTDENRNERDSRAARQAEPEQHEDRTGQPAYPTRDEMLGVVAKKYPAGKVRDTLLTAMRAKGLEDLSDAALKAVYNKCMEQKK